MGKKALTSWTFRPSCHGRSVLHVSLNEKSASPLHFRAAVIIFDGGYAGPWYGHADFPFKKEHGMNGATAHRVHFRLGQVEFNAEGPAETVKEQFTSFLKFASTHGATFHVPAARLHGTVPENGNGRESEGQNAARPSPLPPTDPIRSDDQDGLDEAANTASVFSEDEHTGVISLRALPRTNAPETDTLLLLLLGHLTLKRARNVKATALMRGAKQSGIKMGDRISKFLVPYQSLVTRGGDRHASWYALTNPGIEHAKKLCSEILA